MTSRFVWFLALVAGATSFEQLALADEAPAATPSASENSATRAPALSEAETAGLRFRFLAGGTRRYVYGVPINAVDLEFGAGGQSHGMSAFFTFNYFLGSTEFGLFSQHYSPGVTFEGIFDRTRFGGGLNVALDRITRATDGNAMSALSLGAHVSLSYDLVEFDGGTLLLLARLNASTLTSEGGASAAVMWGPSAFLGIRF